MTQPDWDYDLAYGKEGERIAQAWHAGTRETKRKRYLDGHFYVELSHNPFGTGWRDSGLAITRADYFEWIVGDTGVVAACPTERLRELIAKGRGQEKEETDGECPTRGRLLSFYDLVRPD